MSTTPVIDRADGPRTEPLALPATGELPVQHAYREPARVGFGWGAFALTVIAALAVALAVSISMIPTSGPGGPLPFVGGSDGPTGQVATPGATGSPSARQRPAAATPAAPATVQGVAGLDDSRNAEPDEWSVDECAARGAAYDWRTRACVPVDATTEPAPAPTHTGPVTPVRTDRPSHVVTPKPSSSPPVAPIECQPVRKTDGSVWAGVPSGDGGCTTGSMISGPTPPPSSPDPAPMTSAEPPAAPIEIPTQEASPAA